MNRFLLFALLIINLIIPIQALPQDSCKTILLPEKNFFPRLYMDPTECQTSLGFFLAENKNPVSSRILPQFAIGFEKGLIRWQKSPTKYWEIGIEAASFTQFEWRKNPTPTITGNEFQRNLINIDYKIGIPVFYVRNDLYVRFRFYHTSSHLGDDYLIRSRILYYMPNPNNYEQIDVIGGKKKKNFFYYAGIGYVVRPKTIRKRASLQAGFQYEKAIKNTEIARWVCSLDIKSLEQNKFQPNLNAGLGIGLGKKEGFNFNTLITYYNGNLPYSVFETTELQWIGVGVYFNPG